MTFFRTGIVLISIVLGLVEYAMAQLEPIEFELPEQSRNYLQEAFKITSSPISECSGMIASRVHHGYFWVHNDSGDQPRIFLIDSLGGIPKSMSTEGISIEGATNIDWEEITYFGDQLLIGDIGNNENKRIDLSIYLIDEPQSFAPKKVQCTYYYAYPDQTFGLKSEKNFDCEAMFSIDSKLYLISKHRSDSYSTFYRFDSLICGAHHQPVPYMRANFQDIVTAADFHEPSQSLAVLTYSGVWHFRDFKADEFLSGEIRWLPIFALQCEAICFRDANTLLVSNEQRQVFSIAVDALLSAKVKSQ